MEIIFIILILLIVGYYASRMINLLIDIVETLERIEKKMDTTANRPSDTIE